MWGNFSFGKTHKHEVRRECKLHQTVSAARTQTHKHKPSFTQIQWDNKGSWPGSRHLDPSPLYLAHIFMYSYFLGSPHRWFPKRWPWCEFHRAWASSRTEDVPSQSFMDGANRSHRNQEVRTGALWKIQRSTQGKKLVQTMVRIYLVSWDSVKHRRVLSFSSKCQVVTGFELFIHSLEIFLSTPILQCLAELSSLSISSIYSTLSIVYPL